LLPGLAIVEPWTPAGGQGVSQARAVHRVCVRESKTAYPSVGDTFDEFASDLAGAVDCRFRLKHLVNTKSLVKILA
jgi:hypothetical protein